MDQQIALALKASLQEFSEAGKLPLKDIKEQLENAFTSQESFLDKVDLLDRVFDDFPLFEELRELFFDLLLINFFAIDVNRLEADYLDSPEWEQIEEQTLDRGTEMLNLLLYLKECKDEKITPSLEDYLKDFLLVDEDEFQDEYRIYEPIIENQALIDSNYSEIARVAATLDPEEELVELFYPVVSFFNEPEPTPSQFLEYSKASSNPAFDSAALALILAFNQKI